MGFHGEKPPLALQIVFLGKHLDHLIEHRLAARGLNRTQSLVLIALSRHDGLKALDLCAHARVEPANVTRTLQALERQGLTERRPHPTDGRASLVYPTEAGRALARVVDSEIRAASDRLFQDVGDEDLRALERGLGKVWMAIRDQLSAFIIGQQSSTGHQSSVIGHQSPSERHGEADESDGDSHARLEQDNFDVERR